MVTDQFECAFVTGFRDKTRRICHIYASIIIEKEDFEVNCLYKTRWDSYPSIYRLGGKHFY
jgi:hypothetical protein